MKSVLLQTTSNDPLRRQEDGVADAKGKEGAGLAWSMHYARLDPALIFPQYISGLAPDAMRDAGSRIELWLAHRGSEGFSNANDLGFSCTGGSSGFCRHGAGCQPARQVAHRRDGRLKESRLVRLLLVKDLAPKFAWPSWPRQDIRTVAWKVMPGNMPDGGDSHALRRPLYDGE